MKYSLWLYDPSHKLSVSNQADAVNLIVVSKISKINKLKPLANFISWDSRCRLDGKNFNSKQNRTITINFSLGVKYH